MSDNIAALQAEAESIREDLTFVGEGPDRDALERDLDAILKRIHAYQKRRVTSAHNIAG